MLRNALNLALAISRPILTFISGILPRVSQARILSHFIIVPGKAEPLVDIKSELTHDTKKHRSQFCS